MQCFVHHGLRQAYNLYDEARDGQNIALNYQVTCWCARLSKGTILLYIKLHSLTAVLTHASMQLLHVIGGSSPLTSSWDWVGAGCHQGHLEGEEGSGRGSFYGRLDEEGKNNDICHLLKHALHYIWCY